MLTNAPVAVTLPAVDLERAKKFYMEMLELKPVELPKMEGEESAMFEGGNGTRIYIYKRGATKADHTVASFKVDNIEMTVEELRKKGVKFEEYDMPNIKTVNGIATWGTSKAAWFKDTEGNILSVNQM